MHFRLWRELWPSASSLPDGKVRPELYPPFDDEDSLRAIALRHVSRTRSGVLRMAWSVLAAVVATGAPLERRKWPTYTWQKMVSQVSAPAHRLSPARA